MGTASLILGVVALGVGALILIRSTLGIPPIEVDLVPIALIAIGVYLLFTALRST